MSDINRDQSNGGSDDFILQVFRYLDNVMTDDDAAAFLSSMEGDEVKQKQFVAACLQHRIFQSAAAPSQQSNDDSRYGLDEDSVMSFQLLSELDDKQGEASPVDVSELMHQRKIEARSKEKSRERSLQRLGGITPPADEGPRTRHYVIPKPLFYGSIAAVVAIAAAVIWPFLGDDDQIAGNQQPDVVDQPTIAPVVASLTESVDAAWANGVTIKVGQKLTQGRYELTRGLARIEYESGAVMYIESPTNFTLESDEKLLLHSGKVVGLCPTKQSRGFVVQAPNARVKDLGTEFGVSVAEDGTAETHVYDGKVELAATVNGKPSKVPPIRLNKAEAAAVTPDGAKIREIQADSLAFVRPDEFDVNVNAKTSTYHRWLKQQYELRRHPNLVLHYGMLDDGKRNELRNDAPSTRNRGNVSFLEQDVWKHKPSWSKGRWPQKRALKFVSAEQQFVAVKDWDNIRPDKEMTLAIWVRIDKDRLQWNIIASQWRQTPGANLFHIGVVGPQVGEELNVRRGEPQRLALHLARDGRELNLMVKDEFNSGTQTNSTDGWIHIVMTLKAGGDAKLYKNGVELDAKKFTFDVPDFHQVSGWLTLGGKMEDANFFDGAIDEVMVFDRVLKGPEVESLFVQGDPGTPVEVE